MAYLVDDLNNHPVPKKNDYFFDTNVLIYLMGAGTGQSYEIQYVDFFNEVFKIATTTGESKILTTSLQISELFNRLLRIESSKMRTKVKLYKGSDAGFFKDVFRKSNEIEKVFQQFKSDFLAYKVGMTLVACPVIEIDEVLNFKPSKTDINDHLYVQLVKNHKACLVTHDSDLFEENVSILTANGKLIKESRNFVVSLPIQKAANKIS